jgi:1,4-alpha-glucan branching enzyme
MNAPSLFSEEDLYLFSEGTWLDAYEKLGARRREVDGVAGTNVAVWAPEAEAVSVVGDFNEWRPDQAPLARRGPNGVWEAFLPDLPEGGLYKYHIRSRYNGYEVDKADPYAVYAELRPGTASVVYDLGGYKWRDNTWRAARAKGSPLDRPVSVYEVHLGSWRRGEDDRFLTYRELAHTLVDYVVAHGFTHIELLPITEHPFDGSWGYQTTGYFAPTSRFGTPHDFMYLVDHCHRNGVGVLLDWVPGHFAKEGFGLGYFDGTHLYEHADPRQGEHITWGTYIFNYSRGEVLSFLLSNAHYWLREYHLDGMRVDAVAAMLYLDYDRDDGAWVANRYGGRENLEAVSFLQRFNDIVHTRHQGVLTAAEESTTWPGITRPTAEGGLGFDLKWNMGWMHDTLAYVERDPIYRPYHHNEITFSFTYAFDERYILPLSHDEVVHLKHSLIEKMPGDDRQRFATLRALYAFMYGHPGKKLLFMGGEFAQWHEWAHQYSLDWHLLEGATGLRHRQMSDFVTRINGLYRGEKALYERDLSAEGFAWIDGSDTAHSVVAILRRGLKRDDAIAVVVNWQPVTREGYQIGVPSAGPWAELLNSDATAYGGSGAGNPTPLKAEKKALDGYDYTLTLTLPPLSVLWLKPMTPKRGKTT